MNKRWIAVVAAVALVPGLAVLVRAETPAAATAPSYLGVLVGPNQDHPGARVQDVTADSPAAQAGLKKGDVILKAADETLKDPAMLVATIAGHKPGDKLALHILRDGKEQDLTVTLGERPAPKAKPVEKAEVFLGVWTRPLTSELKEELGVSAGKGAVVMMVMPHTAAAKAGLQRDDVITAVNDQGISTPEELRSAVQKIGAGKDVTLKVMRGKESKELKAHLEESHPGFGRVPFEMRPEMKKHFEEMEKLLREFEEQHAPAK